MSSHDQRFGARAGRRRSRPACTLLLLSSAVLGCAREPVDLGSRIERSISRPNILIYLVDTLRQDRLGCYGYDRPTSPHLDAFAAEATVFANAIGQSSWTRASMASIFTGVWPPTHGTTGWKHKLPETFETLTESLDRIGYQTAAFVGNPQISPQYGFAQGFDRFERRIKLPSGDYNRMATAWLDGLAADTPWFLYIHTMDPHAPYRPPEPFLSELAPDHARMPSWKPRWKWPLAALPFLSDQYDGEIASNDASFGELLDSLKERGLYDDTLIVFTSDHGEEFKEHGQWRHGQNLHAETLNVPLIVRFPGQRQGLRVEATAQHIDLMPTLLDYLGLEIPTGTQGRSLLRDPPTEGAIYSHLFLSGYPLYYSLVQGDWKLIRRVDEDGAVQHYLYDWRDDPMESDNLATTLQDETDRLAEQLDAKLAATDAGLTAEELPLSEELEEELEALGYLQ